MRCLRTKPNSLKTASFSPRPMGHRCARVTSFAVSSNAAEGGPVARRHVSHSAAYRQFATVEAGEYPLAIAGCLGHADTRMMFERYGYLFNHTGAAPLKPRTRFSQPRTHLSYGCRKCGGSLRKAAQIKKPKSLPNMASSIGGDERTRTADPLHAKQVLYQLSYIPTPPKRATRVIIRRVRSPWQPAERGFENDSGNRSQIERM